MGWHIIWPLSGVPVTGIFGRKPVERRHEIDKDVGISILLNGKAGGGMADEDRQQSVAGGNAVEPFENSGCNIGKSPAAGFDREGAAPQIESRLVGIVITDLGDRARPGSRRHWSGFAARGQLFHGIDHALDHILEERDDFLDLSLGRQFERKLGPVLADRGARGGLGRARFQLIDLRRKAVDFSLKGCPLVGAGAAIELGAAECAGRDRAALAVEADIAVAAFFDLEAVVRGGLRLGEAGHGDEGEHEKRLAHGMSPVSSKLGIYFHNAREPKTTHRIGTKRRAP